MRDHSRNPFLCCASIIVAVAAFGPRTLAAAGEPPAVPVLKGTYILTQVDNCVKSAGAFYQITATVDFDPKTGTYKLDGYSAADDPLTLSHIKGNATYSNSGSTFTLGDTTLQAFYGKLDKGVATYVSAIAVLDSCGYQIWMSRQ